MAATAPALCDTALAPSLFTLLEQRFPGSSWDMLEEQAGGLRLRHGRIPGEPPSAERLRALDGPPPMVLECRGSMQLDLGPSFRAQSSVDAIWPLEDGLWVMARLSKESLRQLERRREWLGFMLAELSRRSESEGETLDFHSILHHPESPIAELLEQLERVARSDTPVFLEGESGVGKELFARALHRLSVRGSAAFVAQNGGALTDSLIESELFGHSRGSFTGAREERVGLFEMAHGGTFFLDEVGDLSPMLQVRLLRVLQERSIRRVGENRLRPVDFRLVSATHRDMGEKIAEGSFREDLWFRLSGFRLRIPPLRERTMDIPVLAACFLRDGLPGANTYMRALSPGAAALMRRYAWPGNVRELQNEIARVLALYGEQPILERWMLSDQIFDNVEPDEPMRLSGLSLQEAQEDLERRMIRRGLIRFQGNRSATARALGLSRQGLLKKLKRLDLERVALE
ncbi:sigma-54-dependent Fis family transcriptional regulator [bacterium]|nr:sigma-54-dependent Fis family transcriptional regulator [bacterium]